MARGWGTNLDYKNVGGNMKLLDFNIQLFASGTIDLGASGNLQGRIVWTATSNGSASNSSNGSANLQIRKDPSTTVATKGTFSFKLQAFGKTTESTWYGSLGTGWVTIASISNVVSHNADGTGSAYIYGKATGPSGTSLAGLTVSGQKTVTLDKIARQATITSAPDFNDEENPTITYNNPAGNSVSELEASISLTGATDDIKYRPISKTESSYTFELTDEERDLLRVNAKSNNLPLWFYIKTKIGNDTFYSKISKTMTIINGNPIFNDFVFEDVNEKTLFLTGNNQNIIRGYSNIKVTIPVINKAVAVKQATMTKYRFNCNGSSVDINYSSDADVVGVLNNITSGIFDVYAVDSRNNSTLVTKNANSIIEYTPLIKGAMSVGRDNGVSQDVILKVSGRLDMANFGNVINSIKESKYRYKITNTNEWVEYQDLKLAIEEDGTFSFEGLIKGDTEELGFDIANSYQVEVLVKDELSQIVYSATFGSGIPNIALSKNGVGIMGAYNEELGGLLQVGGNRIDAMGGDSLPIGAIFDYDGNTVPSGYEEVQDDNVFSSEETVIGTWFDKPLYRRVFQTSEALVADTILTITTGLSDIDLMWIDTGNCFMYMNTIGGMKRNVYTIPFHYTPQFQNDYITVQVSASDIQILAHDKWSSNWTKVITVNYTKTTD